MISALFPTTSTVPLFRLWHDACFFLARKKLILFVHLAPLNRIGHRRYVCVCAKTDAWLCVLLKGCSSGRRAGGAVFSLKLAPVWGYKAFDAMNYKVLNFMLPSWLGMFPILAHVIFWHGWRFGVQALIKRTRTSLVHFSCRLWGFFLA